MQIKDRIVVVTGGGSGIGEALAERCVAGGAAHVVVADLVAERAERVAARLGPSVSGAGLDVAEEAEVSALVESVQQRHGPIDLFVSNAGYGKRGGLELSNADFERMWQVHTMAHVYAAPSPPAGAVRDRPESRTTAPSSRGSGLSDGRGCRSRE